VLLVFTCHALALQDESPIESGTTGTCNHDGEGKGKSPPVIDILCLVGKPTNKCTTRMIVDVENRMLRAGQEWGFFHVINHGIDKDLMHNFTRQQQLFFASNTSLKYSVKRTENNSRGFADDELTKRLKDAKELYDVGQTPHAEDALTNLAQHYQRLDGQNQWPSEALIEREGGGQLRLFRSTVEQYYQACQVLARDVLMPALTRHIPCANETYFDSMFSHHSSYLRLNYYPAINDTSRASTSTSEAISTDSADSSAAVAASGGDGGGDGGGGGGILTAGVQRPPQQLGISRHTDAGALTILYADMSLASEDTCSSGEDGGEEEEEEEEEEELPGLQVYTGSKEDNGDGEWVAVRRPTICTCTGTTCTATATTTTAPALTINVGDMLQVWSNGLLKAPEHRVLASTHHRVHVNGGLGSSGHRVRERYSAPFFYNPNYDAVVEPLLHCLLNCNTSSSSSSSSSRYTPIVWGVYRNSRFLGDFQDVGEEVQIEQFSTAHA